MARLISGVQTRSTLENCPVEAGSRFSPQIFGRERASGRSSTKMSRQGPPNCYARRPTSIRRRESEARSALDLWSEVPQRGSDRGAEKPRITALAPVLPTSITRRHTITLWSVLTEALGQFLDEPLNLAVADLRQPHFSEITDQAPAILPKR